MGGKDVYHAAFADGGDCLFEGADTGCGNDDGVGSTTFCIWCEEVL